MEFYALNVHERITPVLYNGMTQKFDSGGIYNLDGCVNCKVIIVLWFTLNAKYACVSSI